MDRQGITGHSMGGHGALTIALRNPGRYRSRLRLRADRRAEPGAVGREGARPLSRRRTGRPGARHDAVALIEDGARVAGLLVDQGEADAFLAEQLRPDLLERPAPRPASRCTLRLQPGYDHSYYFISTFMADHLRWHAERLL